MTNAGDAAALTIYHNPRCGTSRTVLGMIRAAGRAPEVVDYMAVGWTRPLLRSLLAMADASPRDFLRAKEPLAGELGLSQPDVSDERILDAMVAHPILVERPIVVAAGRVKLCRPAERVNELL